MVPEQLQQLPVSLGVKGQRGCEDEDDKEEEEKKMKTNVTSELFRNSK